MYRSSYLVSDIPTAPKHTVHNNETLLFITANKMNVFVVSNVLLIIIPGKMQPDTIKHIQIIFGK
jgi:hypothetical protein